VQARGRPRCGAEIARSDPASETGFRALAFLMKDVQAYSLPDGRAARANNQPQSTGSYT